ncbi:MAG: vitamin B12-dependent ribonucleotide reductase [bacterium]
MKNNNFTDDLFNIEDNGNKSKTVTVSTSPVSNKDETKDSILQDSDNDDNTVNIPLTDNALIVLKKRYLKKDSEGNVIETPVQLFRRVAKFIASADTLYGSEAQVKESEEKFFRMMTNLEFLPNSPTLMNAGRELGQLSACFVLPVEDSMNSIFEAVKNTALIHKSGGGTGFSFSRIRPCNDIVKSTHGIASGPISFLQVFDAATETVKQGGTRRGANMAILRVDHPDVESFITCKEDNESLNNFNISVAITDKFWNALEAGQDYDLINPHSKKVIKSLNAKEVFDKIVYHAWKNGDPGVIFIDRINKDNTTPNLGQIESTNPCGEQPLLPFESCNLGSINLSKMVIEKEQETVIDYEKLRKTVRNAVHFLDNVIDKNKFPLKKIEEQTKATRKIGLGVMGFADLLIQLEIPYNSKEAVKIAQDIMKFINEEAKKKSQELAQKRGAFPAFSGSKYEMNGEDRIRNATRTTIAPTGTISIIAGCSGGVEPIFALSFVRNVMDDDKLPEVHPLFLETLKNKGLYSESIEKKVAKEGTLKNVDEIPENLKNLFVTSHDIRPEWHIRMQAAFQEYTDNAVSKTVNFPNSATIEDVTRVYRLAHDLDCKGVTIYRDGSRLKQVLNKGDSESKKKSIKKGRDSKLCGFTSKLNTGQGSLYVTINTNDEYSPVEVFANIGKSGGDTAALAEAIGRLISIALQNNVKVDDISNTLMGITGSRPVWNEGSLIKSVPDGIGQILRKEFGENPEAKKESIEKGHDQHHVSKENPVELTGLECPDCGSTMETESGCMFCRSCGYSHCG